MTLSYKKFRERLEDGLVAKRFSLPWPHVGSPGFLPQQRKEFEKANGSLLREFPDS